jgi:hypothetical protein
MKMADVYRIITGMHFLTIMTKTGWQIMEIKGIGGGFGRPATSVFLLCTSTMSAPFA